MLRQKGKMNPMNEELKLLLKKAAEKWLSLFPFANDARHIECKGQGKCIRNPDGGGNNDWMKAQYAKDPKGHRIKKGYNPRDYNNLVVGGPDYYWEWQAEPMKDKKKLAEHADRHGLKMGFKNVKEYSKAGVEFLSTVMTEDMEELIFERDGKAIRYRYDYSRNWFASAENEMMTTFYPLDEGIAGWEEKIDEFGIKR